MDKVDILVNRCRVTLILPDYFAKANLKNSYKTLKLLLMDYRNTEAYGVIESSLRNWRDDLISGIRESESTYETARRENESARRNVEVYGSVPCPEKITAIYREATKRLNLITRQLKTQKLLLIKAEKIIKFYETEIKEKRNV